MSKIVIFVGKSVAAAGAGGLAAHFVCSAIGLVALQRTSFAALAIHACAVGLASFFGLLCFARVWIQGYYLDNRYDRSLDLTSRVALVTGGTDGGLGFEAAKILAKLGATVIITVRSEAKGNAAVSKLKLACAHDRVSFHCIDFKSAASVTKGAAAVIASIGRLDMLVLNAGVGTGPKPEMWMTNMLGPFLFTNLLTPLLVTTAKAHGVSICAVSSGAHKSARIAFENVWEPPEGAYGQVCENRILMTSDNA
jgi:hypothetical protein